MLGTHRPDTKILGPVSTDRDGKLHSCLVTSEGRRKEAIEDGGS